MNEISFHKVTTDEEKTLAGLLIREYLGWLNDRVKRDYSLEFNIDAMVESDLTDSDKFQPPRGRFYLAHYDDNIAGVGCLKDLGDGVGEVQRMYVLRNFRGKGIGRAIVNRLIEEAKSIGYRQLRLESLEFLTEAHSLYKSVGFREIKPYKENSMEKYQGAHQLDKYYTITVFMEMNL